MNTTEQVRHHTFEETLLSARRTMVLSEILELAVDSFRSSKVRFALTALGMVIGTASVILVVTIGLTGKQFILQELQKLETNSVELEYNGGGAMGAEHTTFNDYLTREDEKAVLAQLPNVMYSSPIMEMHTPISYGQGVVKALGATSREIKLQFLAEAVVISLIGGIVGTMVGLALPLSVRVFTNYDLPISGWSVAIALAAATSVGVFFGTVPATRAAQLDPVEALRDE
jgi:ABC-type antimicrobial peptide transport system permease subunit